MKKILLCICCFFTCSVHRIFAQEMWGAAHSNYAGQMGIDLNPASIAGAPYQWELHFLSLNASILNNYLYLKADSRLIRKGIAGESIEEGRITDRYTRRPVKSAYASAFVKYPAFIWVGKKYSFGVHASSRAEFSATNIPWHLAKYIKEGFDFDAQQGQNFTVKNAKSGMISWHEVGVSGAAVLHDSKESFLTGGITLNYNYGLNGFYALLENVKYIVPADTLLIVDNMEAEYGHSMPGNTSTSSDDPLMQRGKGYSMNAGVQYYRNRNDAFFDPCARGKGDKPYDYKIGFSIIDAGYIKFNKSALNFLIDNRSTYWYGIDTTTFSGQAYTDSLLSMQFYNSRRGMRNGRNFTMYLPAAASLQFDYPFNEHFFVNLTLLQRIPPGPLALRRSNQLAITPRFESRRFEIAMPVSYFDYFRPRVGLSLRYGIFTIGTDMLGPLLGWTNSYGADLFMGITWKHYKSCGGKGARRKAVRSHSVDDCIRNR